MKFFFVSDHPLDNSDFSIMNGTYNYAVYKSINKWEDYLIYNLKNVLKTLTRELFLVCKIQKLQKIVNSIYYTSRFLMQEKLKEIFKMCILSILNLHQMMFILLS